MCSNCDPNWEPPTPGEGETFDPIADAQDAKRHARERGEQAAAGIPEPTLAELGRWMGESSIPPNRQCGYVDCEHEAVNGHVCVKHERRVL